MNVHELRLTPAFALAAFLYVSLGHAEASGDLAAGSLGSDP